MPIRPSRNPRGTAASCVHQALQRSQNAPPAAAGRGAGRADAADNADETTGQARDHMHDRDLHTARSLDALRQQSLIIGVIALSRPRGGPGEPGQFFHSYLLAYLFWLAGGARRAGADDAAAPSPAAAWRVPAPRVEGPRARCPGWRSSSVPLVFGLRISTRDRTRAWWLRTRSSEKALYLNVPFFLVRARLFRRLIGLALAADAVVLRAGPQRAIPRSRPHAEHERGRHGALLITMTFAGFDWACPSSPLCSRHVRVPVRIGQAAMACPSRS